MHFPISRSNFDKRAIVFFESSSDVDIVLAISRCWYLSLHDFSDNLAMANSSSHLRKFLTSVSFSTLLSSFKEISSLTFDSKLSNNSFLGVATLPKFFAKL